MGTPRLKYSSIYVDLPRRFNAFDAMIDVDYSDNRSAYGVTERLVFSSQWKIKANRRFLSNHDITKLRRFFEGVKDGTAFEFWRDVEFGDGIPFDGKSLTTMNERAQATFTRTGTNGTYLDADTGYITSIGVADTARYEAGKFGRGILLEPARMNQLIRSSEFSSATWAKVGATVAADVATVTDPFGTNTADAITMSNGDKIRQTSAFTPTTTTDPVCVSGWFRLPRGTATVTLAVSQNGTQVSSTTITLTTTWQKFQFAVTSGLSVSFPAQWELHNTSGATLVIYAAAAQLENAKYATSLVPTSATTQTRNTDRLEYTTSHFLNTENRTFTISFWISPLYGTTDSSDRYMFLVDSNVAATYLASISINTSNNLIFSVREADSTNRTTTGSSASGLTRGTFHHVCATCDSTAANGLNIYLDGALHSASIITNAFLPAPATSNIGIGADTGTAGITGAGIYDDIAVFKKCLTAAEVAEVYSKGASILSRRNYFSALRLAKPAFSPKELYGSDKWDYDFEFEEVLT